jgi:photosystem II stability/assembly factor-like uncharacterized protein
VSLTSTRRPGWGRAIAALSILVLTLGVARVARAFPPDEDVFDISVSPGFVDDRTAFAVVGHRLLRSTDGGVHWSELVRGLTDDEEPIRRVEVAPGDASRVYVVTRGDGIFASADGGDSWAPANGGLSELDLGEVAVSPTSPDTVVVTGTNEGVYVTTDGGATWTTTPAAGRATSVGFLADGATIVVGRADGRVQRSADGGATWEITHQLDGEEASLGSLGAGPAGPAAATVVLGASDGRLLRSDDGAATFEALDAEGLPEGSVRGVQLSTTFADDGTMWVSSADDGVFVSTDGGATFEPSGDGLPQARSEGGDETVPSFSTLALAADGETLFLGGREGLFRSDDGAGSWERSDAWTEYLVGLAVSPAFADDGTVVVTSYVKGAFLSTDGGDTWSPANDGVQVAELGPGNEFAPLRRLHNVVFSPAYADDGTIFTANWTKVMRSEDRGATWVDIEVPVVEEPDEDDPEGHLRQFVLAPSPDFADDGTILAGTRQGEVLRSTDGGDPGTWEPLATLPSRVRSLAPSPAFADDEVVFAGTIDGVYRSEDGGDSWDATGVVVEHNQADEPSDPAAHVAVSPGFADDGTVFAGTDRGLFVSHDGGDGWDEVTVAPLTTSSHVEAVAVSPSFADDGTVLVSTRADGMLRSTDGGATFQPVGAELLDANRIVADFDDPTSAPIQFSPAFAEDATVFAYAQTDVFRSTDGGTSWSALELPSGREVLEGLGEYTPPSTEGASGDSGGSYVDTPIGKLSVKRGLAAIGVALVAFGAIQLLGMGSDVPTRRRVRVGIEWGAGALVLALLVLAG